MNNKYLIEKINAFYKKAKIDLESLKYLEKFITSEKDPKFFFTMTKINKIGINPQSTYNTPLGIYSYPLTQEYYKLLITDKLPFASRQQYINLFSISENINSINDYDNLDKDCEKLSKMYSNFEEIKDMAFKTSYKSNDVSRFWNLTRLLSETPLQWNALLRKLGYTNFYDYGEGIIHENEPTQFVILDPRIIIPIETFENPRNSNFINPKFIKNKANLSEENINNIFKSKNIYNILRVLDIKEKEIKPYQILYLFNQDFNRRELFSFISRLNENDYLKNDLKFLEFILLKVFKYEDYVKEIIKVILNEKKYFFNRFINKTIDGVYITEDGQITFIKNSLVHNEFGPAVIKGNIKEYWVNDKEMPSISNNSELQLYLELLKRI